jgi:hypothetical protein
MPAGFILRAFFIVGRSIFIALRELQNWNWLATMALNLRIV